MKMVHMLRLRKIFSGTFVKINKTSVAMMKMLEPYVAWGFPNLKSVRELVLKRGQTRVGRRRVPLTDNTFIEQHMGEFLPQPHDDGRLTTSTRISRAQR
ncbi:60S ribosomal protein L7-like 1 [Notothenia coriiceps]|uniref:60S ribosomal protein L7-like 1 n=1 Tax=Notothenia coriiceps TaxID=8208 RepID=A0A6I9NY94_9TELE|nr:PREDICTED: 60S ribosomal protein L7-like 1 [Notothenia coriiceps]